MSSGITQNYAIPYPIPTDPVNVTGDIEALATRIDNILKEEIEDTAASMWTSGGTFSNGLQAPTYNDTTGKMSMSLSQDIQTSASPTFASLNITGNIFPSTDNTGVVGNSSNTWNNGQFTNFTVDGTLSVRTAIDLADSDILQFGSSDDVKMFYDGTANILDIELESSAVSLNITDNGTDKVVITKSSGNISTVGQLISTVATGTSPLSVSSTTVVTNLNGDLLDGQHGSYYLELANSTGTLSVSKGGTGNSSYTVGDIIYASASTTLSKLSGVAVGNALVSGGTGSAPSWGKIGLATHVSGILPVANGGTGVTTSTGSGNIVLSTSPTFSGTPLAPTAIVDTNTTQIATTAFVVGQGYLKSTTASSTYAPINNPTFTGTVSSNGTTFKMNADASVGESVSFIVERGSDPDVQIRWNDAGNAWQFTNDGTTYYDIPITATENIGLDSVLFLAGI